MRRRGRRNRGRSYSRRVFRGSRRRRGGRGSSRLRIGYRM